MSYEIYKDKRNIVKRAVHVAKVSADVRWGRKMTEHFYENNMFWKEVQRIRKGTSEKEERVKTEDGTMLVEKEGFKKRWAEYYQVLLHVEKDREAEIVAVGSENGVKVLGRLNNSHIMKEEVQGAVKDMKAGKAARLDACAVECLKSGSTSVIEWLVKLFNVCFVTSMVPVDWTSVCVVPLYKGRNDEYECVSFSVIRLLGVVGKVYVRVLIKGIREGIEGVICEAVWIRCVKSFWQKENKYF